MNFKPRKWQEKCLEAFQTRLEAGETSFVFEACMAAGKSHMAAMISSLLLEKYNVDHVLVLVPWRSIQGDIQAGMLGTFGAMMLDARDRFFVYSRRQPRQRAPRNDATITLYQEVCCQEAIETLNMWREDGFNFALICDEIHHTNEIDSNWGVYVEQLQQLAAYSVFMSGTFFRSDKKPISCIPLEDGKPIKHYRFPYREGVKENVVRAVTTREFDACIHFYDKHSGRRYERSLRDIEPKEEAQARKQVLDPHGECIREMITKVNEDLTKTRTKFPDAGCLFVCRPGRNTDYAAAQEDYGLEDRHVHLIAQEIQNLTGIYPTVVTHKDTNGPGKIARFRSGSDPYLVAINMVSEGCDIPRLRAIAFCRYTDSEMLFRQIVGRALRLHQLEDGTAAQIYLPAFPRLIGFAKHLYDEAQEGILDRRCPICGEWPCACPCPICGKNPCECPKGVGPTIESSILGLLAVPILDGGHVGDEQVLEHFVAFAEQLGQQNPAHLHSNKTQLGHVLQLYSAHMRAGERPAQGPPALNPVMERGRLVRSINRIIRQLAFRLYTYQAHNNDFAAAYYHEIELVFKEKPKVIFETWPIEKLREVAQHIEQRLIAIFSR
jgi:superfamily II DNA or RNA helicase